MFRDYLTHALGTVRATTLRRVNVDVDAHGHKALQVQLDAKGSPGRVTTARVRVCTIATPRTVDGRERSRVLMRLS